MTKTPAESAAFTAGALAIPVAIAVVAPMALLQAFVLSKLWNWYVVSFFGVHKLPMVYAYGFALIISFLTKSVSETKSERPLYNLALSFLRPFAVLFFGWIGTLFF